MSVLCFQKLKQGEKSIGSCQKALDTSKELEDKDIDKNATALGYTLFNDGKYEEALEHSKIFVELTYRPDNGGMKQALAHKRLGMCYAYVGIFEKALTCFNKALEIVSESSDKVAGRILHEWGDYCCRFLADQHQETIAFYEKSNEISKQIGDKYQEYRTTQAIGNIHSNTGNYQKATEYYEEALKIAVELRDKHCEGTMCLLLASVFSKDGDFKTAIDWYKKALNIFRTEPKDPLLQEKALTGLGVAWLHLGDYETAITSIKEAQKIAKTKAGTGNYYTCFKIMV